MKDFLGYSAAELHYGSTLALSGTMFESTPATCTDPILYISRLRFYLAELPNLLPHAQSISYHVPGNIETWTYVFIRDDAIRSPLTARYRGPFKVLFRS